jgi:hypothetical protein
VSAYKGMVKDSLTYNELTDFSIYHYQFRNKKALLFRRAFCSTDE